MNLRERCASRLAELESELGAMHPGDLDSEELFTYAREGAAHIERFVKQLSFAPASGSYLFDYINELESRGLPSNNAGDLHAIRNAANAGKHDAAATLELETVRNVVRRAREAIEKVGIVGAAPGADAPEPAGAPGTYAIFVADYPTGGEVDYEICKLLDDGSLVHLDRYQLRYTDEGEVLDVLRSSGTLDQSPATGPCEIVRAKMEGSHEYSGIWLYEGELRGIVDAFASKQHSEAITDLQRRSDITAVRAATAMAAVDFGSHKVTKDELIAALQSRYAVGGGRAEPISARMADLVDAAGVATLEGPRFVSHRRYELAATRAVARDDDLAIAITADGYVFVDVGPGVQPMP